MTKKHSICVTGGTGYIGRRLLPLLTKRGHAVRAVVRAGSQNKLTDEVSAVIADPLKENSYAESIRGCDTFIHLIGVPHPSPAKAAQFRAIDLPSLKVAVKAAGDAGIQHFIYLSVAQPAPDGMGVNPQGLVEGVPIELPTFRWEWCVRDVHGCQSASFWRS